jgi:hypothetical protein
MDILIGASINTLHELNGKNITIERILIGDKKKKQNLP